jgi:FkbM family methyltransferase
MIEAREFFGANQDRVAAVTRWLADAESSRTYQAMIAFRQYRQVRGFPYHGMINQYFGNTFFDYGPGEVFVDCGAFNGDTVDGFVRLMRRRRLEDWRVVALEPDPANYEVLARCFPDPRIHPVPAGASRASGQVSFKATGGMGSQQVAEGTGDTTIDVVAIDDLPQARGATFIKMDIEGAEMDALLGAASTIGANRPKLAICIYHSHEDMLRLPEWVHDNFPDYLIYVRQHHYLWTAETVMYCRPPQPSA